jgi:nitroreductase/dihydropteridine reductase
MSFLESLNWRYAVKRMNGKKVPQEKVDIILEAARLAPTSAGLQPFSVLVITDPELLKRVQRVANNQPQITEASHLLVFAAWDNIDDRQIDEFLDRTLEERGLPAGSLDAFKDRLKSVFGSLTREERFQSAARQAYIAFGVAIAAAATEQVDATPMEGFNGPELDKLLGLEARGLRSVTLLPLGYRDEENDWLAPLKKIRRPRKDMIIELD